MQKGPGPRGEAGIRGDRSRPNDVRGGAAGPGRRLRSFRGVCPPAARWEARADGGGGVASLTRSPPCLPGPGVRLQPALLSRPPSALPGAPTSGAGRRGGGESKSPNQLLVKIWSWVETRVSAKPPPRTQHADPAGSVAPGGPQGAPHLALASRTPPCQTACLCREMTGLRTWVKQVKNPNICISCGFAPFKVKLLGRGGQSRPHGPGEGWQGRGVPRFSSGL